MNPSTAISLAIAILSQTLLCASNPIRIETKIFESEGIKIPHNLTEVAKLEGLNLMTTPSITTKSAQRAKVEITREYQPESVTKEKFESVNTGITLTIIPEQKGDSISFTGTLTISRVVGEEKQDNQTQSEIITRKIYFSGNQKAGQEGWFDLVNPTTVGQQKWIDFGNDTAVNLPQQKKISVWIRLHNQDAEQDDSGTRR